MLKTTLQVKDKTNLRYSIYKPENQNRFHSKQTVFAFESCFQLKNIPMET